MSGYDWLDLAYEPECSRREYLEYPDYPAVPVVTEAGQQKLDKLNDEA